VLFLGDSYLGYGAFHQGQQKGQTYQELLEENKKLQNLIEELRDKNARQTQFYGVLKADRDNLFVQTKRLLKEKRAHPATKEAVDRLSEENQALLKENEDLQQVTKLLHQKVNNLKTKHAEQLISSKTQQEELTQEGDRLQKLLVETQGRQGTQKLKKKLNEKIDQLTDQLRVRKKDNKTLTKQLKQKQKKVKTLEKKQLELKNQAEILQGQQEELEKQNVELQEENAYLAKETREFPKKITDLARQNRKLIKQTANLHYNRGVFYVKNHEYKQAIKEFKKVLDLKPDHAYAHYNLGYLYAEHTVDRSKAIQYFKDYLMYASDAKDVDWVRRYILTWKTWYGEEPAK